MRILPRARPGSPRRPAAGGAAVNGAAPQQPVLPREHGAWGLLFQPFAAGAALSPAAPLLMLAAALLLLAGFATRAALLALLRVWRQPRSAAGQLRTALSWLAAETAAIALCLWLLWPHLSPRWRAGLLAGGPAFTLLAVWIGWTNRQRSRLFQTASAAVLALSAPFAIQLGQGSVPSWGWMLWLVFVLHGAVVIQLVHERLQRRIAARGAAGPLRDSKVFPGAVCVQLAAGAALAFLDWRWFLPPLFSSLYALAERRTLRRTETLREPLTRVGWRTLALSVFHLLLSIAAFWPAAHPRPG